MVAISQGRISWSVETDEQGHRNYRLRTRVRCTSYSDGPYQVLNASGLVTPGTPWSQGNDFDPWATCWPNGSCTPMYQEGEKGLEWIVEQMFSTRPLRRCQDFIIENPLLEPFQISGSFVKQSKPAEKDRNGKAILSGGKDPIVGITRPESLPTVVIVQNVASIDLDQFSEYIDTVNDSTLWGLDARCVKLDNIVWSRQLYGVCTYYYTRRFEFLINRATFDESYVNRSFYKFKDPSASPSDPRRKDPTNYVRITDRNGEVAADPLIVDANGDIEPDPATNPHYIGPVEILEQKNLLDLDIPSVLV